MNTLYPVAGSDNCFEWLADNCAVADGSGCGYAYVVEGVGSDYSSSRAVRDWTTRAEDTKGFVPRSSWPLRAVTRLRRNRGEAA